MKFLAWDLDGTLVNMDEPHFTALNCALFSICQRPDPLISWEEHLSTFKGLPTRHKLAMLLELERITLDEVRGIYQAKQAITLKLIRHRLQPELEKIALMEHLIAEGWRMCVCSNAIRASVEAMLDQAGMIRFMDFYLSNEDAAPKPEPDIYTQAAARFQISPRELFAVEDALPGRQAAESAGCRLISVENPDDVTREKLLPRLQALTTGPRVLNVVVKDIFGLGN
jgi:HAD superfamily hydrolase (TIGR01509 family)